MSNQLSEALAHLRAEREKYEAAIAALELCQHIELAKPVEPPKTWQKRVESKTCSKCYVEKPVTAFPQVGRHCKSCMAENAKARYQAGKSGGARTIETTAAALKRR